MESDQTDCDHGSLLHDGLRIETGQRYRYGICKGLLDIGMAVRYTILAIEKGETKGGEHIVGSATWSKNVFAKGRCREG